MMLLVAAVPLTYQFPRVGENAGAPPDHELVLVHVSVWPLMTAEKLVCCLGVPSEFVPDSAGSALLVHSKLA